MSQADAAGAAIGEVKEWVNNVPMSRRERKLIAIHTRRGATAPAEQTPMTGPVTLGDLIEAKKLL